MMHIRDLITSRCLHSTNKAITTIPHAGKLFFSGRGMRLRAQDLLPDAILLGHFGNSQIAVNTLGVYLDHIRSDGFLPRIIDMDSRAALADPYRRFERNEHAIPVLFQTAEYICCLRSGDTSWMTPEHYESLKRYLRHWFRYWRRSDSGLCVWNSAPHSGMDTAYARAGSWKALFCEGVDLNASLYAELSCAGKLADRLGDTDAARDYYRSAETLRACIQKHLWCEGDRFFYDRDLRTGSLMPIRHIGCFDALVFGAAGEDQAKAVIAEHLLNPDEFRSEFPFPSCSLREESFCRQYRPDAGSDPAHAFEAGHVNWNGGMIPAKTYALAHALRRFGNCGAARQTADVLASLACGEDGPNEWYDPIDGSGFGSSPSLDAASLLMFFLPAELEAVIDPFTPDEDLPVREASLQNSLGIRPIPEQT